jgi:hypothetical protein
MQKSKAKRQQENRAISGIMNHIAACKAAAQKGRNSAAQPCDKRIIIESYG